MDTVVVTKSALLRPMARRWLRGPSWQDGDAIVLDCSRAEPYQPLAEPTVGLELTRVRTADDAVAFVRRFGLLRCGEVAERGTAPVHAREPLTAFIAVADALRRIVETELDVRRAVSGDADALARLRERFVIPDDRDVVVHGRKGKRTVKARDQWSRERRLVDADDHTILIHASNWAAWGLTNGLIEAKPYVYDRAERGEHVPPGRLRIAILPDTLYQVCYLTIAMALADKEPLEICPECQRVFVVEDARQKFCTPKCASRNRFRKFSSDNPGYRKEGKKHGQKTRPR